METTTIEKKNGLSIIQPMNVEVLENFTKRLNERPAQQEIKINKAAKNSKYLPISFIEAKLDEVFAGLWNFEMQREQVIANEIIGVGVLEVFHPIARTWIKRSGTAAVMIQQVSKDNGGTGRISNIDDKIKNTLVKDFPHLETECIKSAAKKLGKMFGRDLNREFEDVYSPIYTEEQNNTEGLSTSIEAMKQAVLKEEFTEIWNAYPHLQTNSEFQKNYQYYSRKNVKK